MIRLKAPLDVQFELTELCTQKCRHCYNYWRYSSIPVGEELAVSGLLNILDQINQAKVGLVTFTGGEPMIRKDVLFECVMRAHNLGVETGLNSNAVLIKKQDANRLSECGLDHALISMLGPEEVHNSIGGSGANFKATLEGIQHLQNAKISVSTNMVISKANISKMYETATILKQLGVNNFCAGPMLPSCAGNIPLCLSGVECKQCLKELMRIGKELSINIDVLEPIPRCLFNKDDETEFVKFFGNRICSAAVSSCAISSTGFMRPCIHSDEVFGSVLPDKFLDIWEKMTSWSSPDILPQECRKCSALMVCEGGCRMSAKTTSGSYNGKDMYMSSAITDLERAVLVPIDNTEIVLGQTELLQFNKKCILRQEHQGYIAFISGKLEYLTPKGFEFISLLQQLTDVSCCSLENHFGYSEDMIMPILKRLIKAKILLRKEVKKQ